VALEVAFTEEVGEGGLLQERGLTVGQPFLVYLEQQTSTDRPRWSGSCQ